MRGSRSPSKGKPKAPTPLRSSPYPYFATAFFVFEQRLRWLRTIYQLATLIHGHLRIIGEAGRSAVE